MLPLLTLLSCTRDDPHDSEAAYVPWKPEGGEVLSLRTRDGVDLVADLYAASGPERPAVLLVHMDPSSGAHRGNWPGEYLQRLVDQDWHTIVPDRRGAGDSGGVATDAFETVKGAYDLEACVLALEETGFSSLHIVAASNGTTSLLDYAALSEDEGWAVPSTLQLLSVVSSTTANHAVADLPPVRAQFLSPPNEEDNLDRWKEADPGAWDFEILDPGAHGTRMFAANPETPAALEAWLEGEL